ncbi:MBL fold metallo-hydrolase [Tersicoccus solisilvae]|uniref:MBL fold metallo-hydrolase n=1 Tax=Tersicoccus solisilvae TaxID=1882339 RepID=A0ABQ1P795_9MICC|nr:MBL fold metallo-hydrolase [Tersicoccus solisilvae]GGC92287.1 MBL fold metallo-hydrolase [Tersicoccus solisilvae]
MQLTKYTHSCVRLEDHGAVLVIDPGSFSEVDAALAGADAVLITHEHPDHVVPERLLAALAAAPELTVHAPESVAASLRADADAAVADRIITVEPGASLTVAGFALRTVGGQHALIHPRIPMVANVGYVIDENVYHPGDCFIVPEGVAVKTLLVPLHAPWSKTAEVIDFAIAVRAPRAFPIHDALLTDVGRTMAENHLATHAGAHGVAIEHLDPGQRVEV